MSDRGQSAPHAYPERQERRPSAVEKILLGLAHVPQQLLVRGPSAAAIANLKAQALGMAAPEKEARELGYRMRKHGLERALLVRALAVAARQVQATMGRVPDDRQLAAAMMLAGGRRCVEFDDPDSWPLATAMAAMAVALAGIPVHVIVATGHLARRDAAAMRPLIESLQLTTGIVDESAQEADRRTAYASDIVYCTHREIALDYLRDRLVLKGRPRSLRLRTEMLTSPNPRGQHLLMRGLQFAIACEAESVLVDSAQLPITISGHASSSQEGAWLAQAMDLARGLQAEQDFQVTDGRVRITDAGRTQLALAARSLPGIWQGATRREEIAALALVAQQVLRNGDHYQVAEKNLQVAEDMLRMHAPGPGDGRLLRLLLEIKEECSLTATRETLARIGYQRFFRRYLRSSALAISSQGIAAELWSTFGLRTVNLPGPAPRIDVRLTQRLYADAKTAAPDVIARVGELRRQGCPVFLVTRTPQATAAWSELLKAGGVEHDRMGATQDAAEADSFAALATCGRVTIGPYFSARGARVAAAPEAGKIGGLRLIVLQLLPAPRHLQILIRRCIPAGAPGSVQLMTVMQDELLAAYAPAWWRRQGMPFKTAMLRYAQWNSARDYAHGRGDLLRTEDYLGDVLAFSGGPV